MKKSLLFISLIIGAFLFGGQLYAKSGCCSWHGGVNYCDTSVGRQVCNDGTYSPTCGCQYIAPKATSYKPQPDEMDLTGRILLQVESRGEAWYLNPSDGKRYYMKDGSTAYEIMRKFGLGITNKDLVKLPLENENKKYPSMYNNIKGRILLQVEANGEAWYIDPKNGYRYYMKDGDSAYSLMRFHSVGITNADLSKIPIGIL